MGQNIDAAAIGRGARFSRGASIPSMTVKAWLLDGIIWVAVGVSLIAEAGFLVAISWWPSGDAVLPSDGVPPSVAGTIVAIGFVVVGAGAFGVGVRRLLTARRAH
jgi:hypothetical protein